MKVAVSAAGLGLDAPIDSRMGRCAYLAIFDTQSMTGESVPNRAAWSCDGSGVSCAQQLVNLGVEVVITGHCGPKGFEVLDKAGIKLMRATKGTAQEAFERCLRGELKELTQPTKAHGQCACQKQGSCHS